MPARKRGLGRGLDALLSDEPATPAANELPLDQIKPNSRQPRAAFDPDELSELARSIGAQGLLQPILVTPASAGGYTIVAGERRWRAAREAGLSRIPVVIRTVAGEAARLEAALVENLQRSDLNPLEEAEAFERLNKEFGLSHQRIAERVGKSRAAVTNRLRLLGLPEEVQGMVRSGALSAGQARPLLSLASAKEQVRLARRAVREGWSARQIEAATQARKPAARRTKKSVDADTAAAAERLTKKLQTKVEIRRRGRTGAVVLHFHSEEELMRLYDMLIKTGDSK